MPRADDRLRHAAASAWRQENHNQSRAAARLLQDAWAKDLTRKQALRLVQLWGPFGERDDKLKDAKGRRGRHSTISDEHAL